ncbi:MAG: DUF1822 family protein [Spirulinaceae cyanobacterium]
MRSSLPAHQFKIAPHLHRQAQIFAAAYAAPAKRQQVYLNTLAVGVVDAWLQRLAIATDLEQSPAWQPESQVLEDTADLLIPGYGRLACRPVLAGGDRCDWPPSDALGCLVVQFDADLRWATLVGFRAQAAGDPVDRPQSIPLSELAAVDDLLMQIPEASSIPATPEPETPIDALLNQFPQLMAGSMTTLSHWLTDTVEAGWQTLDQLLPPDALRLATVRSAPTRPQEPTAIERCKLLNLPGAQPIILVVMIRPQTPQTVAVTVELWAGDEEQPLPEALVFQLLNEAGVAVMQAQAQGSNHLQFVFKGSRQDSFDVKVQLEAAQVLESFII